MDHMTNSVGETRMKNIGKPYSQTVIKYDYNTVFIFWRVLNGFSRFRNSRFNPQIIKYILQSKNGFCQ